MFIKNHYLKYRGHGSNFKVEFDFSKLENLDYHSASKKVAEQVYSTRQGNLLLLYSGGVDSEYILNVFLELKIKIQPVIIKLMPNYNYHDVKYAFDFCESKKLKPIIVDLNFDNFVRSGEILDIARSIKCAAYQLPSTFKIIGELNGTIITGFPGPPHLMKDEQTGKWLLTEKEFYYTLLDYFKKKNLYGCPFFPIYSADQYWSFLNCKTMQNLAMNRIPGKLGSVSSKYKIYNEFGNYQLIERTKFTGFEAIEKSEIFTHENILAFKKLKRYYSFYQVEYFDFLQQHT